MFVKKSGLALATAMALAYSGSCAAQPPGYDTQPAHAASTSADVATPQAGVDTLPRYAAPHFNFVVVVVSDPKRGLNFYEKALGMHERGRAQPDLKNFEVIVGFDDNPMSTGISVKYRNGVVNPKGNGSSAINLVVHDLAGIVGRVVPNGGSIVLPLARNDSATMSYSFAIVKDPDGNEIEMVEYHKGAK